VTIPYLERDERDAAADQTFPLSPTDQDACVAYLKKVLGQDEPPIGCPLKRKQW
jgi:hypothetical protein